MRVGYATDLFDDSSVETIMERFVRVLDAVTRRPGGRRR